MKITPWKPSDNPYRAEALQRLMDALIIGVAVAGALFVLLTVR